MTVQATFAATLVDEWSRAGVTDAVVAPGSRSTPLALALAAHPGVRVHVVLDERSAGFVALGIGLASGRPAVVLTTSGTAAVELHPAVVEAHHAGVALIACTADRPPELHDVGAPQTVDQIRLFGTATRWAADPGVADERAAAAWRPLAARVVLEASSGAGGPGPVHLNLAFCEPLFGDPGPLPAARPGGAPWHSALPGALAPGGAAVDELMAAAGADGVIVAGAGAGDPDDVHALAAALGWPVLADPRSGCRVPRAATVAAADALLRVPEMVERHRPAVVLRLGASWASRSVAEWLGGLGGVPQHVVDRHRPWRDPSQAAATVTTTDPGALCRTVVAAAPRAADASWLASWQRVEAAAQSAIDDVLGRGPQPSEPGIARALAGCLPDGATLMVSSSMPVRDVEWYARPRDGLRYLSNRGANGIDGVTSTALGVSLATTGPTVALLGDLAFLHDSTGLLACRGTAVPAALTLVVVDNDGGGIFDFLPQASAVGRERFERLFATPHGVDLAAVGAAFGLPVERVESVAGLGDALTASVARGGVGLVHVKTDRHDNVALHHELHRAVADAVSRALRDGPGPPAGSPA